MLKQLWQLPSLWDRVGAYGSVRPAALVLNRRLNYRNVLLTDRRGGQVGYLLRNGERRFVPWLGFIDRGATRALDDASPVRLTDITRVGSRVGPRRSGARYRRGSACTAA